MVGVKAGCFFRRCIVVLFCRKDFMLWLDEGMLAEIHAPLSSPCSLWGIDDQFKLRGPCVE